MGIGKKSMQIVVAILFIDFFFHAGLQQVHETGHSGMLTGIIITQYQIR
jgi:hypothetical protein